MSADSPVVVEPVEAANATVIWLHGLGADGHDFEPVVPELSDPVRRATRFVFPHAPQIPVTINGGMVMRAWYDISENDLSRRADEEGVRASAQRVGQLVDEQVDDGISPQRIVLAGFSQGGAVVLQAALCSEHRLAGVMALSTYLAIPAVLENGEAGAPNREIPIFFAHGSQDPMIALALNERSRRQLARSGYRVQCHTYPMPHSVCAEEIRDVSCWLEQTLALPAQEP